MKTRLKTGLLLCGGVLGGSAAVAAQKQPNILLVLSDDQSAFAVGCYGNADIRTPNLARFASEGVRFNRAYATSPQSVPSRASIIKQIALFLIFRDFRRQRSKRLPPTGSRCTRSATDYPTSCKS